MQNYLADIYSPRDFISNFDVKEDKIRIYYDDNGLEEVPYSIEKETEVLKQLRDQVEKLVGYSSDKKRILYNNIRYEVLNLVLYGAVIHGIKTSNSKQYLALLASAIAICLYINSKDIKKDVECINDVKKFSYFLENEELINEAIKQYSNSTMDYTSDVTINDIDKYSYKELKRIVKQNTSLEPNKI